MGSQQYMTNETPEIVIEHAHGDLAIRGWQRSELLVRSDVIGASQQTESGYIFSFEDDATIQLPIGATLRIGEVELDLALVGVLGEIKVEKVHGSADIKDVGALRLNGVDDDVSIRGVRGDCTVGGVGSDANVAAVQGSLKIGGVGDDLSVSDIGRGVTANAGGDVDLRIAITPGEEYRIRAGGEVGCRFQSDASAKVTIAAGGEIRVRNMEDTAQNLHNVASFVIGAGEAVVDIKAGSDVNIRGVDISELKEPWADFGADFGTRVADIAQQVVTQIEAQVGDLSRQLDEKLSTYGDSDEMAAKIQEKIQNTLRRAEERLSEVLKNVEVRTTEAQKRAAEAQSRAGRNQTWAPTPPLAPRPPRPTQQTASEEERKMVLKMVSDKKITVEQAEKLLKALGGGAD